MTVKHQLQDQDTIPSSPLQERLQLCQVGAQVHQRLQEAQGSRQGHGQDYQDQIDQLINDFVPSFVCAMRERILQLSLGECRSIFAPLHKDSF